MFDLSNKELNMISFFATNIVSMIGSKTFHLQIQ